ncbi:hypothetical protein BH09PAT2_BH09PAT2_01000 [soil metagenome]
MKKFALITGASPEIDAPFLWIEIPQKIESWKFFGTLLYKCNVVCAPGIEFGPSGKEYFRLATFNKKERILKAINQLNLYF